MELSELNIHLIKFYDYLKEEAPNYRHKDMDTGLIVLAYLNKVNKDAKERTTKNRSNRSQ